MAVKIKQNMATFSEHNPRILIVDDNRSIHEDFRKILSAVEADRGDLDALHSELFGAAIGAAADTYELESAYQGEEAIARVAAARADGTPFALAFVDVRMPPGIDGVKTTARLLEEDPDLSIVICSAYSDHSWEDMAEALGKTDRVLILKKPFDTVEVRQLAHALQARWELGRLVALKFDDLTAMVETKTKELASVNSRLKSEAAAREDALHKLAESHEQIRALAYEDNLTGLPNRRLLNEHLEKVLARARRKNTEFALLFVDLDNFKMINDSIGHQSADLVLRKLADELGGLIRSDDVLALYAEEESALDTTISIEPITDSVLSRLGGDEFVILLPDMRDRFTAGAVAHRILKLLERPFQVKDHEVFLSVSIGIATYPEDGETTDILIRNADTAMYHAKQQGKAAYQYFSEEMNIASVERLALETGLRRALEEKQFELHYQPQVDLHSGRIVGAEALLRWNHPERGDIAPSIFIPIAEDSGLIVGIGQWVLDEACRQAVAWQAEGLPRIPIAINVSAVQFRRQDVFQIVSASLKGSGLDPAMLCLEITETAAMSVRDGVVEPLSRLRDLGVGLALDDFGTGYSSLSYLQNFPMSTLKIDGSFIAKITTDETAARITAAIVSMAQILGLRVVAEGVEDREQLVMLRQFGCDAVQGFLFSKAQPAERFAEILVADNAAAVQIVTANPAATRSNARTFDLAGRSARDR
jgi:predicted signal transduction protein with EAL and GGDEF domain